MWDINSPVLEVSGSSSSSSSSIGGSNDIVSSNSLRGGKQPFILPKLAATKINPKDITTAKDHILSFRDEFYHRYGGKDISLAMLKKGVRTFEHTASAKGEGGSSAVRATANRFLSAIVRHEIIGASKQQTEAEITNEADEKQKQAEFVMSFAGYSVTVGRGNHLEQSYPYILQNILSPIVSSPPFHTKLIVRNSAIGGIPSFPYGWCLPNFLGEDADLVSWDYGMNEGNGASGLESYVRQALMSMPKSPPLFVMLDNKRPRLDILQKYVNMGVLPDPIALTGRDALDKKLLALPEDQRPSGLQQWDTWGAPKGAPGQSPWHPKLKEHELMGWMLGMHFVEALEVVLEVMETNENWRDDVVLALEQERQQSQGMVKLPPPTTDASNSGVPSLLHGSQSTTSDSWHMNHISCRTSFLPNISGDLNSIIESGVTPDEEDMLQTRDDALFTTGWVMDVGKLERDTKLKVQKYGGLGYIDMKTALYGIPSSGTLKLRIPYENANGNKNSSISPEEEAFKYFNTIILCEVNEKRGDKECKMTSDLAIRVGGVDVSTSDHVSQIKGVASYLKKDICIRVDIPKEAKISSKEGDDNRMGLVLEVTVTGSAVTREDGACSISHVIWENMPILK